MPDELTVPDGSSGAPGPMRASEVIAVVERAVDAAESGSGASWLAAGTEPVSPAAAAARETVADYLRSARDELDDLIARLAPDRSPTPRQEPAG